MQVDLVRELITRLVDAAQREGTLTEAIALQVEASFRQQYHGARCEISMRPRHRSVEKKEVVVREYLDGEPVERITKRHGVSRATLYRYLKK